MDKATLQRYGPTALLVLAGVLAVTMMGPAAPTPAPIPVKPAPAPVPPPDPPPPPRKPCPGPGPCPRSANCPCGPDCPCGDCHCDDPAKNYGIIRRAGAATPGAFPLAGAFAADGPSHAGHEVACELPSDQHLKNVGGSDGAGLCVFASITHAGRWCREPVAMAIFDWMRKHPGGGYPEKVTKMMAQCAAELKLPVPDYIQHTGGDASFIEGGLKSGRYVCVTYNGRDGVYYSGQIAHMVNCVYLDSTTAAIHDNNYPGKYLWMSRDEFLSRWKGQGGGWAIVFGKPGPPPIPVNQPGESWEGVIRQVQCRGGSCFGGGCPSGGCPTGGCAAPPLLEQAGAAGYRWQQDAESPGYWYLYLRDRQIGNYLPPESKHGEGYWRLLPGNQWEAGEPPVDLPAAARERSRLTANYGVVGAQVARGEHYSRSGREISRAEALEALDFAADATKPRLTVVDADPAVRARVVADLDASLALAPWKGKVLVRDFAPTDWEVAGVGMQPGVNFQAAPGPDGRAPVLFRLASYAGPDDMAGAIRRIDPNYNPALDPDAGRIGPGPLVPSLPTIPTNLAWGGAFASLAFAVHRRRRAS